MSLMCGLHTRGAAAAPTTVCGNALAAEHVFEAGVGEEDDDQPVAFISKEYGRPGHLIELSEGES